MNIAGIFSQMLILFATIAVGYAARKLKMVGEDFNKQLSNVVLNFTSPALILHSVISSERTLTNGQVFQLTGIALGSYALLIALGFVVPRLLRVPKASVGVYRFMLIFSNVGFMGFPVVEAIFGPQAVFFAAIFQIPFNALCFTYGVWLITGGQGGRFSWRLLASPMILSTLLAYLLYLADWQAPVVFVELCDFVGGVTSPAAMVVLGSALAAVPLREMLTDLRCWLLALIKLVLIPIGCYFLLRPIVPNELMLGITIVIIAMPVATNTNMLCAQYDGDSVTAAKGVFISTLLSVATIPLLMWLLF